MSDPHAQKPSSVEDGNSLTVYLEASNLSFLWIALGKVGISPEEGDRPATWAYVRQTKQILPLQFQRPLSHASRPGEDLHVSVAPVGKPNKAFLYGELLHLRIHFSPGAQESARQALLAIVEAYEEEVRGQCLGADHFLGNPQSVVWHKKAWPDYQLVLVNRGLERAIADWRLLSIGMPNGGRGPSRKSVRDPEGKLTSVFTEARYYLRRGEGWLLADLSSPGHNVALSLAAVGLSKEEIEALLQRIDEDVKGAAVFGSRRVTVRGEELDLDREFSWDDLFLEPALKDSLRAEIDWFFEHPDHYEKMRLPYRRGLLVHGKPGTGKTLLGKILACTVPRSTFVWITSADVGSPAHIAAIFERARKGSRVILFFEDLDFYASRRDAPGAATGPLGELLVQLDGMQSNEGILVVATTNDIEAIEPALRDRPSRFDRVVEFTPAPERIRAAHLRFLLEPFGAPPSALDEIAAESEGLTGAQLQELALGARRRAAASASGVPGPSELREALEDARRFKSPVAGFSKGRAGRLGLRSMDEDEDENEID